VDYDESGRNVPPFYAANTTENREVYLGDTAFSVMSIDKDTSPGMLGAIIGHETIHTDQIANGRHWTQVSDPVLANIQYNVNEVEGYKWVLNNADKFGLTEEERKYVQGQLDHYYDLLPDEYRKRVDEDNYEIP
jgi:hypothetical protein